MATPYLVDLHGDGHRPGLVEHLGGHRVADPQLGIGLGDGRGQFAGPHAIQQPLLFIVGQGGRQDHQAGGGDDEGGEQQQARRQAARPREAALGRRLWILRRRDRLGHGT
jgi:hypothetical protein